MILSPDVKLQDVGEKDGGTSQRILSSSATRTLIVLTLANEPTNAPPALARAATISESPSSTIGFRTSQSPSTRTPTHRPTTTSKGPAFPTFTPSSANKSPFQLPVLAAIVIPVIIVLAIASIIYKRWRRSAGTQRASAVVATPTPAPEYPKWGESYTLPLRTNVIGGSNQRDDNGTMWGPPQSMPSPNSAYQWGNTAFDAHSSQVGTSRFPSATQPQWPLDSHNQHNSYNTSSRYSNPGWNTSPGGMHAHDQPVEESRQEVRVTRMHSQSNNRQGGGGRISSPAAQIHTPNWGSNQQSCAGTPEYQQPISPAATSTAQPRAESHPRGDIILEGRPTAEDSRVGTVEQRAGSSNGAVTQLPDNQELHMLRERLQRLEAALVEHSDQPRTEDDTSDRPPPAYDSRPGSPEREGGTRFARIEGRAS